MGVLDVIQRTGDAKWPLAPRVVAGGPLLLIGLAHLVGALPAEPLLRTAGVAAPWLMAPVSALVEIGAGMMLLSGWMTRVGGVMGAIAMVGAIVVHFLIPDDRWPQPGSGLPGPEPLGMFLLAWLVLGCCVTGVVFGSGRWGMDRGQAARRASSRAGGIGDLPRVKRQKRKRGEVKEGESVW